MKVFVIYERERDRGLLRNGGGLFYAFFLSFFFFLRKEGVLSPDFFFFSFLGDMAERSVSVAFEVSPSPSEKVALPSVASPPLKVWSPTVPVFSSVDTSLTTSSPPCSLRLFLESM